MFNLLKISSDWETNNKVLSRNAIHFLMILEFVYVLTIKMQYLLTLILKT